MREVKNMKICDCYNIRKVTRYTYHPLTGRPISHAVSEPYCSGTKECDMCNCEGDRTKCDFYEDVRKDAKKSKTITHKEQKVAASILNDFEILMMTHNGPYNADEILEIMKRNAKHYMLCDDPFMHMYCTSKEYSENSLE